MPLPAGPIYSRPRLVLIQFGNIKETSPRMCELYFKVLTKLSLLQRFTLLAHNKTQLWTSPKPKLDNFAAIRGAGHVRLIDAEEFSSFEKVFFSCDPKRIETDRIRSDPESLTRCLLCSSVYHVSSTICLLASMIYVRSIQRHFKNASFYQVFPSSMFLA